MAGPAPSAAGMVLGIGQAAIGGFSAYQSLKAPPGYNPPTKTKTSSGLKTEVN